MAHFARFAALQFAAGILALCASAPAVWATDGYFQDGLGARNKALAGAGVADSRDATAAALNPAGIVNVDNEIDLALTFFSPSRSFTGSGQPGFTPSGTYTSDANFFAIPNIAANYRVHGNPLVDSIALSLSGNGGMNTTWKNIPNPACAGFGGGSGVFCGGRSGVDLTQAVISLAFAKQLGSVSVGVAPVLGAQYFDARGLRAFSQVSSSSSNLTDNGHDLQFGGGVRGGVEWAVTPSFRVGVAGSSKIYMQPFGSYRGLFAEQGGFDIPASLQAGVAIDITPKLTALIDYKRIWYSQVASIGNPSTNLLTGNLLGSGNGPGFGWQDVDAIKLGLEWRALPSLTLRAGYDYNSQPIQSRDVLFNILAPGLVQNHFAGGLAYQVSPNWGLELAAVYAPRVHVVGGELPGFGNPNHRIDISLDEFEVTLGVKYKFDAPQSVSLK